jgi:hypothetical protein
LTLVGVQEERWPGFAPLEIQVGDPICDGCACTVGEVGDCCCLEVQLASLDCFQFGIVDSRKCSYFSMMKESCLH